MPPGRRKLGDGLGAQPDSLYGGGSSTGTEKDGLFSGGTYYGGTRKASFDVSGALTVVTVG